MSKKLSLLFMDQYSERASIINRISRKINKYIEYRKNNRFNIFRFENIIEQIECVLNDWVGKTSVGIRKELIIEDAFQKFFSSFYNLLIYFKENDVTIIEKELSQNGLYQGMVYRYLGTNINCEKNDEIVIDYNDIYVSWSKLSKIEYMEEKLYSNYIILACPIQNAYYGIDLHSLGVGREFEEEVVFPTFQHLVTIL